MKGYVSLHRKIANWDYYKDGNTMRVFLHLLINANFTENGIKRGQIITNNTEIAEALNLTKKQVFNAMQKLLITQTITKVERLRERYRERYKFLYQIEKYNTYQVAKTEEGPIQGTMVGTIAPITIKKTKDLQAPNNDIIINNINIIKGNTYFDKIIKIFESEYKQYRGCNYITSAKDKRATKLLAEIFKKEFPNLKTDEVLIEMQKYIKYTITQTDDMWLHNNVDLMLIATKYNQFLNIKKNGTKQNYKQTAISRRLEEL